MKVEVYSSDDRIGFKLLADNDSDRVILSLFERQSEKSIIAISSKYDCDVSAVVELYVYSREKFKND